jgi:hypothetical protein
MTVYFSSTASVFSSTQFTTGIDSWTVTPQVYVTTASNVPPTTFANVVTSVSWHMQGVETLTNLTSYYFTATTVTVFVQTMSGGILYSSVIDPATGGVKLTDNSQRSGEGFELGVSDSATATPEQVLGWIVNASPLGYANTVAYLTATICTDILTQSQRQLSIASSPSQQTPPFAQIQPYSTSTQHI